MTGQREELGEILDEFFWAFSCFMRCAERPTKISPQTPPNLSLHVLSRLLWLKSQNFISASFWGLGRPTCCKYKLCGPVAFGTTENVPGTKWVCSWTNPLCPSEEPRFSPSFAQWKPSLSLGQIGFVPGTISGMKGGRTSLCIKSLCSSFAR